MTSSDDLQFSLDTNFSWFSDPSETSNALTMTQMGSSVQQVERTNGPTNLNPMFHDHPSLFQEERYDEDLLLEKLHHIHRNDQMHRPEPSNMPMPPYVSESYSPFEQLKLIHENDQMHRPEPSDMPMPPYVGTMLSNQHQIPNASYSNTTPNPKYRVPVISNNHTPKTPESYSPFAHTPYQSDPYAFNFQNSSSLQTSSRRPRGRPRKNQIPMSLVRTNQTLFTSPRHHGTQDKGKQPITTMPFSNPTLYNQYQNSYTNIMTQQSGVLRQRSCYDQLENEISSSKTRRIMGTFQEKSIADSSTVSFWQNKNMLSSAGYAANHHEERSTQIAVYDPMYASIGLPIDPHLRAYCMFGKPIWFIDGKKVFQDNRSEPYNQLKMY